MLLVTVKVVEGSFLPDQQKLLIEGINDLLAHVAGDNVRPHVTVIIEEIKSGLWCRGGEILTQAGLSRQRQQSR